MDLILSIIRYQNLPPEQAQSVRLGAAGGRIGRSSDNDLVLPDPDRWVSGHHAEIRFHDGAFYLRDTSTNGTLVNHAAEPLTQGREVELNDGDELSVGAYDIGVSLQLEQPQPAAFEDPFAPPEALANGVSAEASYIPPAPDILNLVPGEDAKGPGSGAIDDWVTPEPLEQRDGKADREPAAETAELLTEPDHTPDENAFFRPPNAIPEGYDLWEDQVPGAGAGAEPPQPGGPETSGADLQPEAVGQRPSPAVPPSAVGVPPAEVASTGTSLDLTAFLEGLGRGEPPSSPEARAQLLRTAGDLLRVMVQGLMAVMMARSKFKRELRLEMTTIQAKENNPFKFSVDLESALAHLLFQRSRGFLPPVEAAREAFEDIQAHEMAMLAGLRAALRAQMARFDPAELERRFSDRSVLDGLIPMARKAKYWDLFTETYREVAADASEDFLHLFGDAFTRAYEDQVSRLKSRRGRET